MPCLPETLPSSERRRKHVGPRERAAIAPLLRDLKPRLKRLYGERLARLVLYDSGDAHHRFRPWLRRMFDERPAILLGKAVARAITDERAAGQTFNVGERETSTVAERVRRLGEAVGWGGEVVTRPQDALPEHLQTPFNYHYPLATDTHRFRSALNVDDPVAGGEALQRTAAWERQHSPPHEAPPDYAAEDSVL